MAEEWVKRSEGNSGAISAFLKMKLQRWVIKKRRIKNSIGVFEHHIRLL